MDHVDYSNQNSDLAPSQSQCHRRMKFFCALQGAGKEFGFTERLPYRVGRKRHKIVDGYKNKLSANSYA